ncbi:integral membrane protein [Grosmannia clavigera kw1407]|uniref:Integral membrane protein n=1 Tax=Grosmannia clavigera (strain kw1407 / UAMH 11150) TaxID=655863 RepID=F0XJT3_GROCL|nr:uncharacterized protein CMQ_2233 [Grosmannia clavigera kw1407]EFX02184.1 integral membrane protein [Grosmannia clavigera kw1407]
MLTLPAAAAVAVVALAMPAAAHDHQANVIPEGQTTTQEPIDATLWVHILLMTFVWGIMFPVGMVLGIIKSRWHVPLQVFNTALAVLGWVLGHMHKGRQFVGNNVHGKFTTTLALLLAVQIVVGVYLRLHLERGLHGRLIRPAAKLVHGVVGKAFPVVAWVQMVFGFITALGFCQGDHVGQCAAHFIMGGAFVAYGILLTLLLVVGQVWLRRSGRSPEFFDSAVIAAWGCVNTFTEHHWGTAWVKNDWQHTTMGIIWWSAGLAGIWLSRTRDGRPQRNFVPGFVLFLTGWAMSSHPQELMISAATHAMFGYSLMACGVTRIIEVAFLLRDRNSISADGIEINSFQYISVFLLYASGFLFMGATEEQMLLVSTSGLDHVAYILILYSVAFLLFLFVHLLISLYDRTVNADLLAAKQRQYRAELEAADNDISAVGAVSGTAAGTIRINGNSRGPADSRQVRDAEEFELGDLESEEEDDALLANEDEEQSSRRKLLKQESDDDVTLVQPNGHATNGHA